MVKSENIILKTFGDSNAQEFVYDEVMLNGDDTLKFNSSLNGNTCTIKGVTKIKYYYDRCKELDTSSVIGIYFRDKNGENMLIFDAY